jgi:hypothetical protein
MHVEDQTVLFVTSIKYVCIIKEVSLLFRYS